VSSLELEVKPIAHVLYLRTERVHTFFFKTELMLDRNSELLIVLLIIDKCRYTQQIFYI
jgi:hypothetical protein